jgi:hypothetical protein
MVLDFAWSIRRHWCLVVHHGLSARDLVALDERRGRFLAADQDNACFDYREHESDGAKQRFYDSDWMHLFAFHSSDTFERGRLFVFSR